MKTFHRMLFLVIGLMTLLNCNSVDPAFSAERRYKHDLFSSEAECRRRNPNLEISCAETASFGSNGQVDLLLGGGDIVFRSNYKRKNKTITINSAPGLPKEIVFKVVSETELIRNDNGTRWLRY